MWEYIKRLFASSTSNPSDWFVDWVRGTPNESGVDFDHTTPLRWAPLWYAVNKIAGHVGQLPLVLYERDGDDRSRADNHPAYRLMKSSPNQDIGPQVFKETLTAHALLHGNGRAAILRNNRGTPRELVPLLPTRCKTEVVDGRKWHIWRNDDEQEIPIPDRDVLHIAGLGFDGTQGYSVIDLAKTSWGLGIAAENTAARGFKYNAMPAMVIEVPQNKLRNEEQATDFLRRWNDFHTGGGKVGLLRDGMKLQPLSMPSRDAQFVEQRQFQREDAALWMCIETMLGLDDSVSYNSLEQKNLAYLTNCLNRWLSKWEEECNRKLLRASEQTADSHFFKFTTGALLKASLKERMEVYSLGLQSEIYSVNEVRHLEDMNSVEGGDVRRNPAINPQPEPPAEEPEEDEEQPEAAATVAIQASTPKIAVRQLAEHFREKMLAADKRGMNMVSWCEAFPKGQMRLYTAVFLAYTNPVRAREMAQDFAAALTVAAMGLLDCQPEELPQAVKGWDVEPIVSNWSGILEGQTNGQGNLHLH